MNVYFDNAATTKPCDEAVSAILNALKENYGNPSSLHNIGLDAQKILDNTRKTLSDVLSCEKECIYFTSGATESNNLAVLGAAKAYGRVKRKIISSSVEHPSVNEALKHLEQNGFEIVRILPDKDGAFNYQDFIDAADENTVLITMMLVNNENGCILPVKNVFQGIKKLYPHIITHCDAVQGFLKIPVNISGLNADLLTVSGHKVHAAKGTGALYVKKGVRLIPCTFGGKQEKGIRNGTESVPLIAGLNAAAEKLLVTIDERYSNSAELKKILLSGLSEIDRIVVNSNDDYSPYIVNFSVLGIRSEIMLHYLESRNIFVSSGSACSKGAKSSVLRAFDARDDIIDSALRVSFCGENTAEEVKLLIDAVNDGRKKLKGK